jgi:hypothetical protein
MSARGQKLSNSVQLARRERFRDVLGGTGVNQKQSCLLGLQAFHPRKSLEKRRQHGSDLSPIPSRGKAGLHTEGGWWIERPILSAWTTARVFLQHQPCPSTFSTTKLDGLSISSSSALCEMLPRQSQGFSQTDESVPPLQCRPQRKMQHPISVRDDDMRGSFGFLVRDDEVFQALGMRMGLCFLERNVLGH